jgi:hypothetical protein
LDAPPPIPTNEDLQSLVERFGRAKWIADLNVVAPKEFSLVFTWLGQRRIRQIFSAMQGSTATNFPDEQDMEATVTGRVVINQLADALSEIQPPRLSDSEWEMLKALTHGFVARNSQ